MNTSLKITSLHQWHKDAGANMSDFGGFDMPLWYETGVKNEHLAVLKSAGIFDTSHMACINVGGKDAFSLLNYCFTRDITSLSVGRCIYGAFLNDQGHCIDDAIVYKFNDSRFMVCVNAGMGEVIAEHLNSQIIDNQQDKMDVTIDDLTGKVAKMDIQGKNSARILSKLIKDPELVFQKMPYFSFKGYFSEDMDVPDKDVSGKVTLLNGTPILLSRSGYTGEFGFEIFLDPSAIVDLWKDVLKAGAEYGIAACGLGARDSLRAGACLPLSHQDIGNWKFINHPWDFALPYSYSQDKTDKTGFTKEFLGADALIKTPEDNFVFPFVGENLRKVNAGEQTQVLDENSENIGRVLTCATDMGIGIQDQKIISINTPDLPRDLKIKGISCGFIMVSKQLDFGDKLTLKEGKRTITVTIVPDIRPDRTARKKLDNFI
ncbi:MAG: glycine cleavage system protein T [Desulfobacteraceae bacterium 4572_89]|nr:MAG: glycine cleavage system protein T [Desulfobacteraceae bacterium 4572_89]